MKMAKQNEIMVAPSAVATQDMANVVASAHWANIKEFGLELFKSGWIKGVTEGGAVAAAIVMVKQSIDPIEFSNRYHVIDGIPRKKPNFMLGEFKRIGGRYSIVRCDDQECEISFTLGDTKDYHVKITIEQMLKTNVPYAKDGSIKANWQNFTDDMLFARVVGKGLRRVAPELVGGEYTDAEAMDFEDRREPRTVSVEKMREMVKNQEVAQTSVEPVQEGKYSQVVVDAVVSPSPLDECGSEEQESISDPEVVNEAEQADSAEDDQFMRCPIGGKYEHKLFTEISPDVLVYLTRKEVQEKHPELTPAHIANVEKVLKEKGVSDAE